MCGQVGESGRQLQSSAAGDRSGGRSSELGQAEMGRAQEGGR